MATPADQRRPAFTDTGPQGTRVFRREEIDAYLARRAPGEQTPDEEPSGAAFIGLDGPFRDLRYDIPPGWSTLGRGASNDIVIETESVSLVHARVIHKENQWRVMNLLSTNGTYVNGRKVTDRTLEDGDHVRFGDASFQFTLPKARPGLLSRWLRRIRGIVAGLLGRGAPR